MTLASLSDLHEEVAAQVNLHARQTSLALASPAPIETWSLVRQPAAQGLVYSYLGVIQIH